MNEILNMSINEMPRTEFDCSCGRRHNFSVHDMAIGKGAIEELPRMAEPFKDGKILMVFDNNTYRVAGKKAAESCILPDIWTAWTRWNSITEACSWNRIFSLRTGI